MFRIGFVGVPGAGKTSTARAVSASCRRDEKLSKVELVSEYARRYISKYGTPENIFEQIRILEKQLEWEDVIPQDSTDLLITDSPVNLCFFYALELRDESIKSGMVLSDIFKKLVKLNSPPRYDIIFHLPPILKPVDDGVRPKSNFDDEWRKHSDEMIKFVFNIFPPSVFISIEGVSMEERVSECEKHLHRYLETKIQNF